MVFMNKEASELQTEEIAIHKALKSWYMAPGIQRELRNKENEAMQVVLEVLEHRRAVQKAARTGR